MNQTLNKMRNTSGTMAGAGIFSAEGSLDQRRPGSRSNDVMDRVNAAMDYRAKHGIKPKKTVATETDEIVEEASQEHVQETQDSQPSEYSSGDKKWFSKWF